MWQLPEQSTPANGDIIVLCYKDRSTGQPRIVVGLFHAERSRDTVAWSLRIDGSTALRSIPKSRVLGWAPWLVASREAAKHCTALSKAHKYEDLQGTLHEHSKAQPTSTDTAQCTYTGDCQCQISISTSAL